MTSPNIFSQCQEPITVGYSFHTFTAHTVFSMLTYGVDYPQSIHRFLKLQIIVIVDLQVYQYTVQQPRSYNTPFGFTHTTLFHADRQACY